jgi:hypothetical protein
MVSRGAREHARRFVRKVDELKDEQLEDGERLFREAVEDFVLPAVMDDGPAREVLADVVEWVDQDFDEEALREIRNAGSRRDDDRDDDRDGDRDDERLPDLDQANGLALATGYLRAAQELADPDKGPRIREALRAPGQHRQAIQQQLGALEDDFKSALLQETVQKRRRDDEFREKSDHGFDDLRRMENHLRRIGTSGEGRESSWAVGVGLVCSLGLPWCVAAAVVVVVVVVVVIVARK